ncbi:hypothetical protein JG687_00005423 [Phytophthora cactorum]|uniref:Oxidoreductase FAD/NAD(P)-binding domain-containing protein n=1 Tax=Phytophthora cactorum TaxID=29920 RepID=A0A8T1UNS9_9STRA|nr:hypothetical protein JG687_00005423 [Phytophthora cactorum]
MRDELELESKPVALPCGHFYLESSTKPIVFISGGVGFTPLLSMLESLVASSTKKQPHIESIAKKNDFATAHTVYGKFDINELEKFLSSKDSEFYFCGPAGITTAAWKK